MTIDLTNRVLRVQLRRFLGTIACAIVVFAIMFLIKFSKDLLGLNNYQWGSIIAVSYILFLIYEWKLDYHYVYFSEENQRLIFRFFSIGYFNRKKNVLEFPAENFVGYDIRDDLFGLKHNLVLKVKVKDKIAPYPQIVLSLLTKKEYSELINYLDKVLERNNVQREKSV